MKKIIKINESQLHNIIEKVITEEMNSPRAYMEHWEHKFMKSIEILLDNGYNPNQLMEKIKIIANKKQI
jgi:hypothetical protein